MQSWMDQKVFNKMLQDLQKTLEYYINQYEIADGCSTDYYCDELLVHPMGIAKYILTLCSLYRSGLLSHSKIVQKTKQSIIQLSEISIYIEETDDIYWGLNFEWINLKKDEPYLITTALVVQSLFELANIIEKDLVLKKLSEQALSSLENWVNHKHIHCNNMKISIPKYSFILEEPVFNAPAYAYAVLLKYSLNINIKDKASKFMNLLWQEKINGVGWKYSNANNVIDLLHTCYIQNAYFISGDKKSKENINELLSMINQFNCDNYFKDALLVKNSFDEWNGNIFRYINDEQYLELKNTEARLWSIGELLVLLSNMMKINNHPSLEKFTRNILLKVLRSKFNEKDYFRHTMHYTHGLASFLEVIRNKKVN